jgi:hypothetical protein
MITEHRPRSRKLRALQEALGMSARDIALAYRVAPLTYRQMAAEWEARVSRRFPAEGMRFNRTDVYRLFRKYG